MTSSKDIWPLEVSVHMLCRFTKACTVVSKLVQKSRKSDTAGVHRQPQRTQSEPLIPSCRPLVPPLVALCTYRHPQVAGLKLVLCSSYHPLWLSVHIIHRKRKTEVLLCSLMLSSCSILLHTLVH